MIKSWYIKFDEVTVKCIFILDQIIQSNVSTPIILLNPFESCTEDRKNYCWFSFQSCKYECPCGDQNQTESINSKIQTTCLDGCPCAETANKKEYCDERPEFGYFSIIGNDTRVLDMKYGVYPDVFGKIEFDWRNFEDDLSRHVFQVISHNYESLFCKTKKALILRNHVHFLLLENITLLVVILHKGMEDVTWKWILGTINLKDCKISPSIFLEEVVWVTRIRMLNLR